MGSKRGQTPVGLADRAVIDDRDLAHPDSGPVASEGAAAEVGALPPELLAILHAGPGGPAQDGDDLDLERDGDAAIEAFEPSAPSVVDDRILTPESDL